MAFRLYSTDDGHVPAWEYYECSAIAPKVGMGMALSDSGQLVASATPAFICMRDEAATVEAGTKIPVVRINDDQVWESQLYKAATSLKVGMKVDIVNTGLYVDGTATTNANFDVSYLADTVIGSVVRGRFVK